MAEETNKGVSSAAKARFDQIKIVDKFPLGYRNREDITNLPPGVLTVGSQNVLSNISERIQMRQGYALDGAINTSNAPILSSFDWNTRGNGERNMRAGFNTSGSNGKLQFRFESASGDVTWTDLKTSLTNTRLNYTTFWDATELLRLCLFVAGSSFIYEWNGAVTTFASATANTITKQGSSTWAQAGFYTTRDKKVVIEGTEYTYTGGETTTTLTGVTPDPTAGGHTAGDSVHQQVVTTANSSMTDLPATFTNDLISTLNNQVFVGSLASPTFYASTGSDYKDFSFTAPVRLPGEGATGTLDDNIVAFKPQEDVMYISAGANFFYNTQLTLSADLTSESFSIQRLKTTPLQGAYSQAFMSNMKNNIIMLTKEPTLDIFGRLEDILGTPQTKNISDSIKLDFDQYDFDDGSIFYNKYFIYLAVPKESLIRIYNLATNAWEAPQTIPVSRFYTVGGELYGHSYQTSESYKLFTGYADRVTETSSGNPIQAIANFSYQNFGSRTALKSVSEFYIEGYINQNTDLSCSVTYEIDGCATQQTFTVDGADTQIVCIGSGNNALGKYPLGSQPLGGQTTNSLTGLPPKFRVVKTFAPQNFYECQFSFTIYGLDQRFELLAFGLNATPSTDTNFAISQ